MIIDIIPEERLRWARRRFARKLAAAIIHTMAETDYNFTQIAARIGRTEKEISSAVYRLLDGDGSCMMMDFVSDIFLAMGCELDWSVKPIPEMTPE